MNVLNVRCYLLITGHNVVIVSSGAVGVGCQRLKLATRPSGLARKQAVAAVGQVYLMHLYDQCFTALSMVSLEYHGPDPAPIL